ncbi:MAG: hypothetical protein V1744_02430 [Candidatus Altiarchaeota archaeon]
MGEEKIGGFKPIISGNKLSGLVAIDADFLKQLLGKKIEGLFKNRGMLNMGLEPNHFLTQVL